MTVSRHRRLGRLVALAIVVSLPSLGIAGVASAKKAPGCHKTHSCKSGGTGGGTGGPAPLITVQIDPNPLVETGSSIVAAVIQVETSPAFAGDAVNISSSQLSATCAEVDFFNLQASGPNNVSVILDNDGNATVLVHGEECAPGSDIVEADLVVAPFYTALGTLTVLPPAVTPPGLTGFPTTSGTVTTSEVETGDTPASGDSNVYAVFYVETNPVYAEQQVEISSAQLEARCLTFWWWSPVNGGPAAFGPGVNTGPRVTSILDNDGNAAFIFRGSSCAAGSSQVIADVLAGTHPTYTTTFNVNPPQPTI